jgi:2-oxoglutarate dehydrogenase E1 component
MVSEEQTMPARTRSEREPPERTDYAEIIFYLKHLDLFRDIPDEDLARIAAIARTVEYGKGQFVCRQGEQGQDLFAIIAGSVWIQQGSRVLAKLNSGEVVGELAFLDHQPRSADVVAAEALRLLEIRGVEFQRLIEQHGLLAHKLLQVLAARVRKSSSRQERVDQLVRAYRERGHVLAALDPLGFLAADEHPELTLSYYGLEDADLKTSYSVIVGRELRSASLKTVIKDLRHIYCGPIGWQYMHIDDLDIQNWLRERIEDESYWPEFGRDEQLRILSKLTDAEIFETFLQRKFSGTKRFSLEGGETLIPLLDQAIEKAGEYGVQEVVIGMAHRGRLNVLANILGKAPSQIFREFEDAHQNQDYGSGDVKYHQGFSGDKPTSSGNKVWLTLCFNPSHLEFVGPVVLGRTRAKQDGLGDHDGEHVLPIVIHGDAAFAGQGVVQELFNLSNLRGYSTGGAIHIILNNQIGFTTPPSQSRSTQYATDVARMLQIPIFHVDGERPEAVDKVTRLAMDFRARFHMDAVIDMYCYRRHGHNERDDPTFTQPLLYEAIRERKSLRETFTSNLLSLATIKEQEATEIAARAHEKLERQLVKARSSASEVLSAEPQRDPWAPYHGGPIDEAATVFTGVSKDRIISILTAITSLPEGFTPHPRAARLLSARQAMAEGKRPLDWAAAEALAFATLLSEGVPVRLSGQDSERGTFGHRHAVLYDSKTEERYAPLEHVAETQGRFTVINSPLSELGVLGFEYGYSLDNPEGLVIWEAQFGDFCNVAQVIIDQFISASEDKWQQLTGLCLFLPHGFEGEGPEHSSARLERFLHLAAKDNMRVVSLSTSAQLFHCLRQQVLQALRKPLILMSPKSLLQHPAAGVSMDALVDGAFLPVIGDEADVDPNTTTRIILCCGKIYYELAKARANRERSDVALIRVEQLYPFPEQVLSDWLGIFPDSTPVLWVQEEPENMGAWPYLRHRLQDFLAGCGRPNPMHVTRPESASPAVGSKAVHGVEQARLIDQAFAPA